MSPSVFVRLREALLNASTDDYPLSVATIAVYARGSLPMMYWIPTLASAEAIAGGVAYRPRQPTEREQHGDLP